MNKYNYKVIAKITFNFKHVRIWKRTLFITGWAVQSPSNILKSFIKHNIYIHSDNNSMNLQQFDKNVSSFGSSPCCPAGGFLHNSQVSSWLFPTHDLRLLQLLHLCALKWCNLSVLLIMWSKNQLDKYDNYLMGVKRKPGFDIGNMISCEENPCGINFNHTMIMKWL